MVELQDKNIARLVPQRSVPDNATPTLDLDPTPPHESRDSNQPIANFRCISVAPEEARFSGDPNGVSPLTSGSDGLPSSPPFWDSYDSINQLYLEAGRSTEMRSHYRGHKMSLWLNLLPQLHRPGYEISMRHHHLAESPSLYEGAVRPQTMALPLPAPPLPVPSPTEPSSISSATISTTECTPNATVATTVAATTTSSRPLQHSNLGPGPNNLLRKLASSHYQSYTTALTVTIAVGVFLLLLNILIFAGIYHQRDRNASNVAGGLSSAFGDKKKEELLEAGCSGIEMSSGKQRLSSLNLMDSPSSSPPSHKTKLAQELELQLQEFQCSPPPGGGKRVLEPPLYSRSPCVQRTRTPSPCKSNRTVRELLFNTFIAQCELDEFPAGPKFRSQSDRAAELQSARAPERKQSDQLGNDEIRVGTCVTRMTRNNMQVKTLRMLEELAITEEEELNNDGDSLDNIQWNEFANKQQSFTFTGKSGLLMELPSNISPGEILSLFLDEKVMSLLVTETRMGTSS
ncbi:Neuroligin-3 [Melipona quadrifasciata]|uniref:Neuroligin-3 n=1 Tax=Melipona quadrifasciata TaxID=166423 RepID=A0A0M9A119_9HYME|nr:Neuroligin-3 [Melipona quadrifasciata]